MKKYILPICNRIKKDYLNNRTGILAFAGIFLLFIVLFGDVCPSQLLLGMPCPGCGLTRAGLLVLQLKFAQAWQMHPFIYAWMVLAAYVVLQRYIRGKKITGLIAMIICITIAMFLFYVYRMYMFYPNVEPMVQKEEYLLRRLAGWLPVLPEKFGI